MAPEPSSTESGRLSAALRALRVARRLTQTQLAKASGISLRAIQGLETGRTRAPQFYTLTRLADVLASTDAERHALFDAAYPTAEGESAETGTGPASPTDTTPPDGASSTLVASRSRRWAVVVAVALAAALVVAGLLVWRGSRTSREPPADVAPTAGCATPPPPTLPVEAVRVSAGWEATVVNTWSTSRCMDLGTRPRADPVDGDLQWPGYFTGSRLVIRCYVPDGLTATDRDTRVASKVWYRLAEERPRWLSALVLAFGQESAVAPPDGMPRCRDV